MLGMTLTVVLALATGCKRDNASPFTHGAQNAPNSGGTTKAETSTGTSTTGTQSTGTEYGGSTATSGGVAPAQDHPTTTGASSGGNAQ
jgi:hypothetical protein